MNTDSEYSTISRKIISEEHCMILLVVDTQKGCFNEALCKGDHS